MSKQSHSIENQQVDVDQNRPKRVRRTRKDCDQRSYICKYCQRSYLSNAALYTHVKNKHENVEKQKNQNPPPENASAKEPKQAEPSRSVSNPAVQPQPTYSEEKEPVQQKSQKEQNVVADTYCEALQGLRQYMKKYYPERNKGCTIRLICEGLSPQILAYAEPLLKQCSQMRLTESSKHRLSVNKVFGLFLTLMNVRVSSTCINFLIRFFYYLHLGIGIQAKRISYCDERNPEDIPNFFNNVILNHRIPPHGSDEDEVMHNPRILCKILEYFGNWLYKQGYTDYKVIPNYKQDQ